ncbi:MAG: DUF456 family protein [Phycisphaerales bacterium]
MTIWWAILAGAIMALASLAGVVVTLLTLPGVWLVLAAAVGLQIAGAYGFVLPEEPFSWWTIGVCTGVALLGEAYELAASAVGAKRSGGGRSGAAGSVIGALLGAVAGTVFIPVPLAGTLIGAVAGAGIGAVVAERGVGGRTWEDSLRVGRGAAVGRFAALLVKGVLTAAVGVVLVVAAVL